MCHNPHQRTVSVLLSAASVYCMSVLYLTFFLLTVCVTVCETIVIIWVHRDCVLFTYAVGTERESYLLSVFLTKTHTTPLFPEMFDITAEEMW